MWTHIGHRINGFPSVYILLVVRCLNFVTPLTSRKLRKFQVLVLTRMVSFSLLCDFQVALRAAVTRQAQIGGNGCPVSECWRGEEAG